MAADTTIVRGFVPGAVDRIVEMHGDYYGQTWKMGPLFTQKVAMGLEEFSSRYDPNQDLVLLGLQKDKVVASLILDLHDTESGDRGAHLRWFIVEQAGRGLGKKLLNTAMQHVDRHCGGRCWLTTFEGLEAARHLYEQSGFVMTQSQTGTRWGYVLVDQTFERPANAMRSKQ